MEHEKTEPSACIMQEQESSKLELLLYERKQVYLHRGLENSEWLFKTKKGWL